MNIEITSVLFIAISKPILIISLSALSFKRMKSISALFHVLDDEVAPDRKRPGRSTPW
jgi:hypothetical protein